VVCVKYDDATDEVRGVTGTKCDDAHWTIGECTVEPDAGVLHGSGDHMLRGLNWWIRLTVGADGSLMEVWGVNASGASRRLKLDESVNTL
jgi:hypothetical protein